MAQQGQSVGRRDRAAPEEKYLVFGYLMVGAAHNWYLHLSRTVRKSWDDLVEKFRVEYCD